MTTPDPTAGTIDAQQLLREMHAAIAEVGRLASPEPQFWLHPADADSLRRATASSPAPLGLRVAEVIANPHLDRGECYSVTDERLKRELRKASPERAMVLLRLAAAAIAEGKARKRRYDHP